jgi:hypothetical protein
VKLRWGALPLVVAALVAATSITSASAYDGGADYFSFQDESIEESSGVVAASHENDDVEVWWTHNDSDSPAELFEVDRFGCTLTTYDLEGDVPWTDVEDIAKHAPTNGAPTELWVGDIGDNLHERAEGIYLYRLDEPNVSASSVRADPACPLHERKTATVDTFHLVYPDQPQDAETLLVDPDDGRIYIVTKTPLQWSNVYATPEDGLDATGPNTLELLGTIVFPPSGTYKGTSTDPAQLGYDLAGRLQAVGGDIHPERERVVIRTYTDAWEWELPDGADLGLTLTLTPPTQTPLLYERQGEAIAYSRDGTFLVTTCEGIGCTGHVYR